MNKKNGVFILGAVLISGAMLFFCAGCGNKSLTGDQKQTNANSAALCDSAKEIDPPNEISKELKKIFSEAGGEVKLTSNVGQDSSAAGTLAYVWKNKPKAEKLESVFEKYGYKVEISGLMLIAAKGDVTLSLSSVEGLECQEVVVNITDKPFKLGEKVTIKECAKLLVLARRADYSKHDLATSWANSLVVGEFWDALATKYGVTRDDISKTCEAKVGEPGFNEEVERQEKELQ